MTGIKVYTDTQLTEINYCIQPTCHLWPLFHS